MSVSSSAGKPLTVQIESWPDAPDAPRVWTETSAAKGATTKYALKHVQPNAAYAVNVNGRRYSLVKSDKTGQILFTHASKDSGAQRFEFLVEH
jgi:hypothetical protein